jgi:hypothetical protein
MANPEPKSHGFGMLGVFVGSWIAMFVCVFWPVGFYESALVVPPFVIGGGLVGNVFDKRRDRLNATRP